LRNSIEAMAVADLVLKIPLSVYGLVLVFGSLIYLAQVRFKGGLRKIPGPVIASLTNWWRLYDVFKGSHQQTLIDLHRKHASDLIRIGPNTVSVADPEGVKTIYGLNKGFTKASLHGTCAS
jgi:hypothetical protein